MYTTFVLLGVCFVAVGVLICKFGLWERVCKNEHTSLMEPFIPVPDDVSKLVESGNNRVPTSPERVDEASLCVVNEMNDGRTEDQRNGKTI